MTEAMTMGGFAALFGFAIGKDGAGGSPDRGMMYGLVGFTVMTILAGILR